jgi:hypothetical protein
MFVLPTRSPRIYRGKYPTRIHSWSYSRSPSQQALAAFLGINRPVHLELNEGTRFIAEFTELSESHLKVGTDIEACLKQPTPLVFLSQDRYDLMLSHVRRAREA